MIKNTWKKIAFKTLPLVLAFIAVLWFGVAGSASDLASKQREIENKEKTISQNQRKLDSLKSYQAAGSEINEMYERVKNLWPDGEEVSKFTVQIEGLASERNITLSSLALTKLQSSPKKSTSSETEAEEPENKKVSGAKIEGLKFNLNTKTDYSNARNFIIDLENLARLNSVESINLSSNQENALNISISGNIYAE